MRDSHLRLSTLPKTWIIDLDGVVLRHNGYLYGMDEVLPGAVEFWAQIKPSDLVVVMTARPASQREETLRLLAVKGLRVDQAVFDLPTGERILINDSKPSGLPMAYAMNVRRDHGLCKLKVIIDENL